MNIEHLSVSRSQCYNTCPAQYKFKYHDKLPVLTPEAEHFVLGKAAHSIIEEHTLSKGQKDINLILTETLSSVNLTSESVSRLKNHVHQYRRLVDKIGFNGFVEWEFSVDLDPPNNKKLVGFIDRLILDENKAFIIDFKTSRAWRKDSSSITKDVQLICYSWVVKKYFELEAKNITSALYYLEDGQLVPARFSEKTLEEFPDKFLEIYNKIQSVNPDKAHGNVGSHCKWCDYRKVCPFYSLV